MHIAYFELFLNHNLLNLHWVGHVKIDVAVAQWVKAVEHFSTIVLVNIWVARVRVPLVLSVGIWICNNSTINT